MTQQSLLKLVELFEHRSLPATSWTHEAHLSVALYYLHTYSITEATCLLRAGIITYNHLSGGANTAKGGYHETLTLFWIYVIADFVNKVPLRSLQQTCEEFLKSPMARKEYLSQYYSPELLFSTKARAFWTAPDLKPLNTHILEVRPALLTDLPLLKSLFYDSVMHVCQKDYTQEQLTAWASSHEQPTLWEDRLANQYFFVAELKDKIVGFTSVDPTGYIDLLFVHKDHQRQGIAKTLLAQAEYTAIHLGAPKVWADVSLTARKFFWSQGFTLEKEYIKDFCGLTFNNAIMHKPLNLKGLVAY